MSIGINHFCSSFEALWQNLRTSDDCSMFLNFKPMRPLILTLGNEIMGPGYEAGTSDTPLQLMVTATLQLLVTARSAGRVSISRWSASPPPPHFCQLNSSYDRFLTCLKSPAVTCCLSHLRWTGWFRIKWVTKQSSAAEVKGSSLGFSSVVLLMIAVPASTAAGTQGKAS